MTRNDTPDKLEWFIRPCSETDLAQWDWGITSEVSRHVHMNLLDDKI